MRTIFQTLKIGILALGLLGNAVAAEAVQLADGRVLFDRPPTLIEATTFDQQAGVSGRYHFVVQVPENAGEPLKAIAITPRDHAQQIKFKREATVAQQGVAYASGPALSLTNAGGEENSADILVAFEQPVQPGETVTVTLQASRNPWGGVYLFGVTAYPAGENSVGQFLGYGRIHIYDNSK